MAIQPPTLTLSGDQSEVWAGGTLQLTAMLAHGGAGPDEYVLSIRGVDPAWVTLRPPTLSVEAGSQAYATIVIAPPADAASEELVLTVRAFARMSNVVVEATQIALLYGASGAAPMRVIAPADGGRGGLSRNAILAFMGGIALLAVVVGVLVVFAIRSRGHAVANASCVARPLKQVDLYSDDVSTAIRIREPDLSDMKVLRTEPADTLSPLFSSLVALSPDGSRIAYVTASNEALDDAHLWVIDVANPSQRQELANVPKGMWVVRPAWSADSRQVAFVRYNDQQATLGQSQLELWVGEAGQQPRKVASPPELRSDGFYGDASQSLCWSQDNRNVIFPSLTSGTVSQAGKSTGTARSLPTTPPVTLAVGPRLVAVDVLTGSTEALASPAPARDGGSGTQSPGGTGLGACGLPAFSQNDPTWRNVIMQSSGDTIGRYGCAVTASAMLMNYYGAIVTPPQLTACLEDHADLLAWANVAGCANGAVTGNNAFDFSWPGLDQVLAGGNPAIVGLLRGQTGLHFVVVTSGGGGEASNYIVNDPWDGTTTKTLQSFIGSGYNPRWIRTFVGTDHSCPRLVGFQTPAMDATGVAVPPDGPLLAPAQLLPTFAKVAEQTGVPKEILLAMARVESGFTPRAMGPPNPSLSGTDDERALGMMQFLPSTYRQFSRNVDAATGKPLGDAGIWDAEASIWAAAFFLQQHGIAADPRAALGAFTAGDWYPDLVLKVAAQYRTAVIADDNLYDANGTSKPGTLAAPNPINPPAAPGTTIGLASSGTLQQAGAANPAPVVTVASGSVVNGTAAASGSAVAGTGAGRVPIRWNVPDGSVTRQEVRVDITPSTDIGAIVKFTLFSLSLPGSGAGVINQPTASRPLTSGTVIRDDGVYEAVLVTSQGGLVRVSRRRFTIDRTPPRLDVTVSTGPTPPPPGTTGTSTSGSATGIAVASRPATTPDPSRLASAGLTRLKIGSADQLSGVQAVEYQLDGGLWQLYFGDVSYKPELFIAAPGNHTIRVRATDFAGNVSTERALDFAVTAQPRTTTVPGAATGTFVPILLSPTPLTSLGTVGAPSAPATTPTVPSTPSATVPLSAIIATAPGAPGGAPGAAAGAAGVPGAAPGAPGAPAAPGGAGAPPPAVVAPGGVPGAPAAPAGPGTPGSVPVVGAGTTAPGVPGAPGAPGAPAGPGAPGAPGAPAGPGTTSPTGGTSPAGTTTGTASGTPAATGTTAATATTTSTSAPSVTPTATPAPIVRIDPITCPDTIVGNTDTCTLVTITNAGTAALSISKTAATGDFSVGDSSCSSRISAGAACQIVITFAPTTAGSRVGRLTVTDNAGDSPQSVPLSGRGVSVATSTPTVAPTPAPAIRVDPVTCPDTLVATTATCSLTTITNTSSTSLSITGITATGEFAVANNSCASGLAPGAPCQVVVTFTPAGTDTRVGSLTIAYGGAGSPRTIPLSGKGIAPIVTLSPAQLTCPDTHVPQTATCQAVLSNTGSAALTITSITMSSAPSGFSIPNNPCGTTLGPGATCQIVVTFAPTTNGKYTGTLTINDNAAGSPHSAQVTGNGIAAPAVTFSTTTVACPDTRVTTASPCPVLTLTNSGTAALTVTKTEIVFTAPSTNITFTIPNNACVGNLNPGASCTITITFTPSAPQVTFTAMLVVTDNASDSPQKVQLTGKGIA